MSIQEVNGKLISSTIDFIHKIGDNSYYCKKPNNCTEISFEEWKKMYLKSNEVESEYESLWYCKTILCGLHSGFPLCCVLEFIADQFLFRAELFGDKFYLFDDSDLGSNEFDLQYHVINFEFSLCPKCIDLLIHKKLDYNKFNFKRCDCWHGSSNSYLSKLDRR